MTKLSLPAILIVEAKKRKGLTISVSVLYLNYHKGGVMKQKKVSKEKATTVQVDTMNWLIDCVHKALSIKKKKK